jgi:isoleucyl-tRNA synthetase
MAQVWMHNGFLQVEGEKMAKSLGNFVTVRELLETCDPRAIRLALMRHHYRAGFEWFDTDLKIMDPWLAEPRHDLYLMTRYAMPTWDGPSRAIYRIAIYRYDLAGVPFAPGAEAPIVQESLCGYPY